MLTRTHRQEGLCRAYVQAIAAQAGLIGSRPEPDYGIDLSLRSVERRENRYRDTGIQLDVQPKSTTRANVTGVQVIYDLEVDAYNDLREEVAGCPHILVLLVMPEDETQWLAQTVEELSLRHCAYWHSLKGQPVSTAVSSVRITIPLSNVFSAEAVTGIVQRIRERKDP